MSLGNPPVERRDDDCVCRKMLGMQIPEKKKTGKAMRYLDVVKEDM